MIRAALALCLVASCWRGDAAPAPALVSTTSEICAEFLFKHLLVATNLVNGASAAPAFDTANAEAIADAERAEGLARSHMLDAAHLFLSCATRFRSVPDDDPLRDTASYNATACYENAMYAYAMAGRFAAEGRPELERSITADPPMANQLRRMLAAPPRDCAVRR